MRFRLPPARLPEGVIPLCFVAAMLYIDYRSSRDRDVLHAESERSKVERKANHERIVAVEKAVEAFTLQSKAKHDETHRLLREVLERLPKTP